MRSQEWCTASSTRMANTARSTFRVQLPTYPQGINDQGQVVGTMYDSSGNPHGFSYSAGVFQMIDFPGALFTEVYGINNGGVIVGFYGDAANFTPYGYNVQHAFQLANGIFTTVGAPPFAYESYAYSTPTPND